MSTEWIIPEDAKAMYPDGSEVFVKTGAPVPPEPKRDPLQDPETNCSCDTCRDACNHKPGWFLPGEAEKAAELLRLSMQEFFDKHLGVDWLEGYGDGDTFVLAPATVGSEGEMYAANPKGRCTFFKDGQCSIYATRPFECRAYHHTQSHKFSVQRHEAVGEAWKTDEHRQQIRELLGDEPYAAEYSIFEALSW